MVVMSNFETPVKITALLRYWNGVNLQLKLCPFPQLGIVKKKKKN